MLVLQLVDLAQRMGAASLRTSSITSTIFFLIYELNFVYSHVEKLMMESGAVS